MLPSLVSSSKSIYSFAVLLSFADDGGEGADEGIGQSRRNNSSDFYTLQWWSS